MKTTPSPDPTSARQSDGLYSNVSVVVSGLGQKVMVHGTGQLANQQFSCLGQLVDGQSFDLQGLYDIYSGVNVICRDTPFNGGSGTAEEPWVFTLAS